MNRSVLIAIGLTVFVLAWLLSGTGKEDAPQDSETGSEHSPNEVTNSDDENLFKVTIRALNAEAVADIITLQGDIEPARNITVKAETHGRISATHVNSGSRVQKGQRMLNIAVADRQARLEQAEAELKLKEAELQAANQLKAKKLISGNQLEQAVANVAAAKAAVKQIKVEINYTTIRAAFTGIANYRHVELGDYVAAGDPLIDLIDDQHIKIVARIPQQHISKLKIGQHVSAELLDGQSIQGQLSYISSQADPATRTFTVKAIAEPVEELRLGQSARVRLKLGEILAHKVSSSALSLAANGDIFVNAVSANGTVVRHSAEIIKNDSDGVWLSGLPGQLDLIVVGQAFVTEGQAVEATYEGEQHKANKNEQSDTNTANASDNEGEA